MIAVDIRDLQAGYALGGRRMNVLDKFSLSVDDGEFLTVLGPSGCGKSTLLRVIADLVEPFGGRVSVFGETPKNIRWQRELGFVFQDPALLPWRTARENIRLPASIGRSSFPRTWGDADDLLDMMRLSGLGGRYPHQLSVGQSQRVAIARALMDRPRLLLMDEPFGALDEITRDTLNDELLDLWRSLRTTIVFVTHSISEAVYLGQRVLVLSKSAQITADRDLRSIKGKDNRCRREDVRIVEVAAELRRTLKEYM